MLTHGDNSDRIQATLAPDVRSESGESNPRANPRRFRRVGAAEYYVNPKCERVSGPGGSRSGVWAQLGTSWVLS